MRLDLRVNYLAFKNQLFAQWQKLMAKKDDWVEKVVAGGVLAGLVLWIFYEIAKAGAKGEDVTINRCGNCNWVLKPKQSPCPNCGYSVLWK